MRAKDRDRPPCPPASPAGGLHTVPLAHCLPSAAHAIPCKAEAVAVVHSRTPWCHTSSKATPSLCPWRTFNKTYSTSVLGLCLLRSPCATATSNYAPPLRYPHASPPLYHVLPSSLTSTLWLHCRTPWCHTSSKATPSLCPWRTFNKTYSTSVLGLCLPRSPCATATRNYAPSFVLASIRQATWVASMPQCCF